MQNSLSENKAPVKTSQTVLLKEAVTLEKNLHVWFSGNVTNICKRFGLLNRGVAQCSLLSVKTSLG